MTTPRPHITVTLIHTERRLWRAPRTRHQPWRWKAQAGNGRVLAVSSEAYTNRQDALDAARTLFGDNTVYRVERR